MLGVPPLQQPLEWVDLSLSPGGWHQFARNVVPQATHNVGHSLCFPPRPGRVSFFTSGSENLHRVEKVRWGTRYAITIAFTCNPDQGIADPTFT